MQLFIYMYLFILGLFIGSFLNVVALRIPKGESIVAPPSHCPVCKHRLGIWDLIPLIGYLLARGRCRYCGTKIPLFYPVTELATALLFLLVYSQTGITWELPIGLLLVSLLVSITISDLKYRIIPNKVILFFLLLFVGIRFFYHPLPISDYLYGLMFGGGLFLLIAVLSRGGLGGGDVKLMALLGIILGWKGILLTIFLSSLIGTISGVFLLAWKIIGRREPIPYGPFIALAALIVFFWEEELLTFYLQLFH